MVNGERVRQARELRKLTQTELATRCLVEQAAIARIESGDLKPSDALVQAISEHMGFPVEFFHQPTGPDFPLGSLLFRAHLSTTLRERAEAYRYAQITYEIADTLAARMKPSVLRLPQGLDQAPADAAGITRSQLGLSPDTPVPNLLRVVETAGVLVLALPVDLEGRDAFSSWAGLDHKQPVIFLSANRPGDRVRWNIAHEVAHLVLHPTIKGQLALVERQADEFAAEFLMPEAAMRRELAPPITLDRVARLKPRWRVAVQSLVRRAHELEIISKRQYTYLFEQIGARGWRTHEPDHLAVPVEKPRALRKMAELIYGDPVNHQRMAKDMKMAPSFVKRLLDSHADKAEYVGSVPPGRSSRVVPIRPSRGHLRSV